MPINLSTRELTAFLTLADQCNFTRAAARCHLSQPAFSALVRALEESACPPKKQRPNVLPTHPAPAPICLLVCTQAISSRRAGDRWYDAAGECSWLAAGRYGLRGPRISPRPHHDRPFQRNGVELDLFMWAYYRGFPWSDRVLTRFGYGWDLSIADPVPYAEVTFVGLSITHRSGMFGNSRLLGRVNGGSSYVTLYVEHPF